MKSLTCIIVLFISINFYSQIDNLVEKFELPEALEETSGLIFYNNKLITHNDSGNSANLYELDTITETIARTIVISNATNRDWEDIDQDDDYIYIGDFGNNNGDRTDLKIYRVEKLSYLNNTTVSAEVINFSYEDQTDFTVNNQTNFNAEAMVIYNDNILIFTKNHGDLKTNAYIFPKTIGTHTAIKIGTYNVSGLITGATFNTFDNSFFLTGYGTFLQPFLVYLGNFVGNSIFDGTVIKTDITTIIGQGSQLEGITNLGNERYFLSREKFQTLTPKVYAFSSLYALDIDDYSKKEVTIYPNPFINYLKINTVNTINKIEILDVNGRKLKVNIMADNKIELIDMSSGVYFLKVYLDNKKMINKKIVKL